LHNLTVKKINYIRLYKKTPNREGANKLGSMQTRPEELVLGKLGQDFFFWGGGGKLSKSK